MYKKLIIIFCLLFLFGCTNNNINKLSLNDIINDTIKTSDYKANVNSKGYKYFLPNGFSLYADNGYQQEIHSKNSIYYLNVDVISYYYKNDLSTEHELDDYEYYEFENNDKKGYLRITKNNEDFFVELCYNYAIIEVEVEESNLRYAVSRGITILNSIEYNDLVIEKNINDGESDHKETIYNIPEPEKKNTKNVLEYIEEDEEE